MADTTSTTEDLRRELRYFGLNPTEWELRQMPEGPKLGPAKGGPNYYFRVIHRKIKDLSFIGRPEFSELGWYWKELEFNEF